MFRFLHTSDLHLGKPFGRFGDSDTQGALKTARADAIGRLAEAARDGGAAHVLVAGDVFDSGAPSATLVQHALAAMGEGGDLTWWLITGNHDPLAAEALWDRVALHAPPNVRLQRAARPVEMAPGVTLLPAPVPAKRPGADLTAWMDGAPSAEGALRIGLAHGTPYTFGSDDNPAALALDREERARLDYLALGDRHGFLAVASRTYFSGTPERDGFDHDGRGTAALVALAGPGAPPEVTRLDVGRYDWRTVTLELTPGADPEAALRPQLPAASRREVLVRVVARGRATLADRARLSALCEALTPEFRHFDLEGEGLGTEHDAADLDAIGTAGALRIAAEGLRARALAASGRERAVAEGALNRLYSLALEVKP